MIKIFKKFFRFSGEHRRAWYLSVVLEFLRCIAEAIQFFPLFLVLLHLVDGTMTPAVAWTALGLVALSVALQAVLHYFSHKLEMRACYLMLDDKRISIGERMKYMPMGYFNDRSLGNLTAICTSTMEDLESMAGAIVVRILAGVLHALVFSLGFMIIDWRIGLIFLAGVVAMLLVNSRMLAMSRKYSPERLAAQMRLVDAVLEYIQGMSVIKAFSLSGRAGTSIEDTIDETERRRSIQDAYNQAHGIVPKTIVKAIADSIEISDKAENAKRNTRRMGKVEREAAIERLTREMKEAAKLLEFEHAAFLRDQIDRLRRGENPTVDSAAETERKQNHAQTQRKGRKYLGKR